MTAVRSNASRSRRTGLYHIHGLILVERDGQKKMVIGNKRARRSRP